jgi:hypothetical protein
MVSLLFSQTGGFLKVSSGEVGKRRGLFDNVKLSVKRGVDDAVVGRVQQTPSHVDQLIRPLSDRCPPEHQILYNI